MMSDLFSLCPAFLRALKSQYGMGGVQGHVCLTVFTRV